MVLKLSQKLALLYYSGKGGIFSKQDSLWSQKQNFFEKKGRTSYWIFLTNKLVQRRGIFIPDLKKNQLKMATSRT